MVQSTRGSAARLQFDENSFKQAAKSLQKSLRADGAPPTKLMAIQEMLAKAFRFDNWHALGQAAAVASAPAQPLASPPATPADISLFLAIEREDAAGIERAFVDGARVEARGADGSKAWRALLSRIERGRLGFGFGGRPLREHVWPFLSRGAPCLETSVGGENLASLILHASAEEFMEPARFADNMQLLDWVASRMPAQAILAPSHQGWKAIHSACMAGNAAWVHKLLAMGESPDARTDSGETPLLLAAFTGNLALAELFVGLGASRTLTGSWSGQSLAQVAKDSMERSTPIDPESRRCVDFLSETRGARNTG